MTNQVTVDKLLEMRLSAMSDAFLIQMSDVQMQEVAFEDRFGMLVDAEYTNRKNNSLKRLIKNASFDQPDAHISAIDYNSGRKLNRALIERLATCEYITEYRNIFITGATGSGKTYMACALGMEACKHRFKTKYIRLPDLLMDLGMARAENNYRKVLSKYANPVLLILDEWLLLKPTETEQHDFWSCFIPGAKSLRRFSALSTTTAVGMTSSAAMTARWQKRSWIGSNMMPTRSTSSPLIRRTTAQCARCTVWIRA